MSRTCSNDDTGHQEGDDRADSEPAEDKQTKRYQAEEANCRRQERGNLEMGQYATPADLIVVNGKSTCGQQT